MKKKMTYILMTGMLILSLAGCGGGNAPAAGSASQTQEQTIQAPAEKTDQGIVASSAESTTAESTTAPEVPETTEQTPPEGDNPPALDADLSALDCFNHTTDDLISVLGDDYEVMYWQGAVMLLYEQDIGIFPGTYDPAELTFDSASKPHDVLIIGNRPLFVTPEGTLVQSGTWPQMRAQLNDVRVSTGEPEFFHNEMDDIDEYLLEFDYNGYQFRCEWYDDPQTTHCGIISIRAGDV